MKTPNDEFQLLLQQTSAMYNSEKEISGIFEALNVNTSDAHLKEGI